MLFSILFFLSTCFYIFMQCCFFAEYPCIEALESSALSFGMRLEDLKIGIFTLVCVDP